MRTSATHPIQLDGMTVGRGRLSLTLCPGKKGDSLLGKPWNRDLAMDVTKIAADGADVVVSLIEMAEATELGVPDLGERIEGAGLMWLSFPIRDCGVPGDRAAFEALADRVSGLLDEGRHVVVHCKGGLGRAGTLASTVLVRRGVPPDDAIRRVRAARNGAVENERQERWIAATPPAT